VGAARVERLTWGDLGGVSVVGMDLGIDEGEIGDVGDAGGLHDDVAVLKEGGL